MFEHVLKLDIKTNILKHIKTYYTDMLKEYLKGKDWEAEYGNVSA